MLFKEDEMLKGGIFLDVENLTRNGGWGLKYHIVSDLVEAQGAEVLRANVYLAADLIRERKDSEYASRNQEFRNAIRRSGFHLVLKEVKRYRNEFGETILKANADLDLAVDAIVQADNLDYILIGSGDGDFIRLVRALQNRGRRVDILAFGNASGELVREADFFFSGFLVPGLIDMPNDTTKTRYRGILYSVNEDRGFGFLGIRRGLRSDDVQYDIFCHITDFKEHIDSKQFAEFKTKEEILEFDIVEQQDGKFKATNISQFNWSR
jgi:uncharacterized LabA/DUF88 family protein/cold shock CspA family protein